MMIISAKQRRETEGMRKIPATGKGRCTLGTEQFYFFFKKINNFFLIFHSSIGAARGERSLNATLVTFPNRPDSLSFLGGVLASSVYCKNGIVNILVNLFLPSS